MDQNSKSHSTVPVQTTSPEEDATLLAIEALEARTVDPNPRPLHAPHDIAPRVIDIPERVPSVAPIVQKVIEPIIVPPVEAPVPKSIPVAKADPIKIVTPEPKPDPKPAPVVAVPKPAPKKPLTTSEKIADALAHAPTTKGFQFFAGQKAPRKQFVIIAIIAVVIAGGIAAYFATR